jgi:predicted DNA-binding protein
VHLQVDFGNLLMSIPVTIDLPEELHRRAERLAGYSGRAIADVLRDSLEAALRPLGTPADEEPSIETWSDEKVLAVADSRLPLEKENRLRELLDRQQAGTTTESERTELAGHVEAYQVQQLRKARALVVAVQRGLREPLSRAAS